MPKMNLAIPHTLGQARAAERLRGFVTRVKERHGDRVKDLEEEWSDNCLKFGFTTYGFRLRGTVTVEESQVRLDGELPFAASMFKGKIEQEIRDTMQKVLSSEPREPSA